MCVCVCVCVCVCERERERECVCVCVCEREREIERETETERQRDRELLFVVVTGEGGGGCLIPCDIKIQFFETGSVTYHESGLSDYRMEDLFYLRDTHGGLKSVRHRRQTSGLHIPPGENLTPSLPQPVNIPG